MKVTYNVHKDLGIFLQLFSFSQLLLPFWGWSFCQGITFCDLCNVPVSTKQYHDLNFFASCKLFISGGITVGLHQHN
jgi:hypothetical protein